MSEKIIHIKTTISRDDLDAVIVGLETACGGIRIDVDEVFDLHVQDERQAVALKALFGSNGEKEPAVKHRKSKEKKAAAMGAHSYRFAGPGGEVISRQALNKRLEARDVACGIVLLNAKGDIFHVVEDENDTGGAYRLVNAGQWEAETA
jgi:hypothetical protein